ncbi:hypothetical protein PAXRUDRAFT_158695 [Paxillus rubicundulus Ve08.2h10]|uniref:Uncharacterized protein n=1 Tax=Paxillus rubicundulus Ve08.2h10 TaxID=930991 RepID=A0A0D0DNZ4_9AGAM|nr:hypothetical protein PAXRUDRAFT_158695 [Paxillus rubicundulus Ve08.2h10]
MGCGHGRPAGICAWHLLHRHSWKISLDELRSILEGASHLAPPSSKWPKCEPFEIKILLCFLIYMDLSNLHNTTIYTCLVVTFYCIAQLSKFTVPAITKFDCNKHITCTHVYHLHDANGLPVTKFQLPSTKCAPEGEDTQCTPLNCLMDPM